MSGVFFIVINYKNCNSDFFSISFKSYYKNCPICYVSESISLQRARCLLFNFYSFLTVRDWLPIGVQKVEASFAQINVTLVFGNSILIFDK